MTSFYLLLGLYYFAAIIGVVLHRYFAQFTANDFKYNRTLKITRRLTIIYYYAIGFFSFYLINYIGDNDLGWLSDHVLAVLIIISIVLIIFLYGHIAFSLEAPKKFNKKRRWK